MAKHALKLLSARQSCGSKVHAGERKAAGRAGGGGVADQRYADGGHGVHGLCKRTPASLMNFLSVCTRLARL